MPSGELSGEAPETPDQPEALGEAGAGDLREGMAALARLRLRAEPTEPTESTEPDEQPKPTVGVGEHPPTEILRQRFPDEYIEPTDTPSARAPFEHPKEWVAQINSRYREGAEYQWNCVDCARSVENTWRGRSEVAAGRVEALGEDLSRTEKWYDREFDVTEPGDIAARLTEAGHGASSLVEVQWTRVDESMGTPVERRGGHAFNMLNHEGEILVVDGQVNTVEPYDGRWPPSSWGPGLRADRTRILGFDRNGGVL